MNLSNLHQTALRDTPDKAAYICGDAVVSYHLLDEKSRQYAAALKALGIEKGDRVALTMHNIPQLPQLYLALYRIGAIAVPISPYSSIGDFSFALSHCTARLFLVSRELYPAACEAVATAPLVETLLVVDDRECSGQSIELPECAPELEPCDLSPSDPLMILYTSGSTARSKGIIYTSRSLRAAAVNRAETLGMTAGDIYFNAGYLCHGAALTTALLPALYAGATALFPTKFSPPDFFQLVNRYHPTIAAMGPSHLWAVLEHPLGASTDLSTLRYVSAGGDVVGSQLHEQFLQRMQFPLSESIGMTECGTYMTTRPGMPHKTGSMGKPVIGAEVRLIDEQGHDVATGETGQVIVRTESCMAGYWNDDENTALALVDRWLHTGDAARKDDDGYYYFAGRIKQMLVRDCVNISPKEVEDAVKQHPQVKECCIIGIPDPRHGQKIFAFVQLKPGERSFDEQELIRFTGTRVMQVRLPDRWIPLDALPVTQLGKLDRKKLQEMALLSEASV